MKTEDEKGKGGGQRRGEKGGGEKLKKKTQFLRKKCKQINPNPYFKSTHKTDIKPLRETSINPLTLTLPPLFF